MPVVLLTPKEREKFASWLEQDIESAKLIIEQLAKLPGNDVMTSHAKQEVVAEIIVLKKLRSVEEVTISGGEAD